MEDFWFQLAFYSLLLDAGCQISNLLMCTIPWVFLIHTIRKAEVLIAVCGGLESYGWIVISIWCELGEK